LLFYKYNLLIINDSDLFKVIGLSNKSDEDIKKFAMAYEHLI